MSVSARNMPNQFVRTAQRTGFGHLISTNQVDANLLNRSALLPIKISDRFYVPNKERPWSVVASPLASGWLTDRHLNVNSKQPRTAEWLRNMSLQELFAWETSVKPLCGANPNSSELAFRCLWENYQSRFLLPLQEISRKHNVSIASILLRWTLQLDHVASTVVASRLLPEHFYWDRQSSGPARLRQLREVVLFELDEEDMEILRELSGWPKQLPQDCFEEQDWLDDKEDLQSTSNGLWL